METFDHIHDEYELNEDLIKEKVAQCTILRSLLILFQK